MTEACVGLGVESVPAAAAVGAPCWARRADATVPECRSSPMALSGESRNLILNIADYTEQLEERSQQHGGVLGDFLEFSSQRMHWFV